MSAFDPSPAALKRRFKQRCVDTGGVFTNWQIRVHRSLSWSLRAAAFDDSAADAEFLYHWIAFNSLYGKWDASGGRPAEDRPARNVFLRSLATTDADLCDAFLLGHKPLLKKLLGSVYLSASFWRDPKAPKAETLATAELYTLDRMLKARQHGRLFELAFERVYVLRGQLVHGASSGGSRLNRGTVLTCLAWLRVAVPLLQHLTIEHRADDDWPELCYPPIPR